ncbi:MAG: protein kinase [Myxococcales bacterium]|nr:protein kinase [Myxococcales bacterium]
MSIAADSNPPGDFYCPTCERTFQVGDRCPTDQTRLVKLAARLDALLGRDLDGRYTILEKLGQGGMGAVYRSSQHSVGREVAIKVVSPHLVSEADVIKRFLREAKLASRLSHPNAVAVLDFGQTDDGVFYLVMELVTGRTLDAVIKADRVFRPERVVRIGTQVCDALEGAHALQIVHRDLKPANIMLLSSGRDLVKVLDFGLAKSVAPDQAVTTMTNAGALLGTPAFMPPELALGQPCDGRADLYSLGVVLYLLGSGHLPFQSESAHELIAMHGTETAPPMTDVPAALGHVIDRLLAKNPADRYQSAAETREALEAALETRYNTPPYGTSPPSFAGSTGSDLAAFATPAPSATLPRGTQRRSATELDRLINSDTMAAVGGRERRKPPRALPIVLASLGAIAIGAVAFFATGGFGTNQETPPPPPLEVKQRPAVETPLVQTPAVPTPVNPDVPAPNVTEAVDAGVPAMVTIEKKPAKPPIRVKPHGHVTKPVKPVVETPPPAQGSGSAVKPKLPF